MISIDDFTGFHTELGEVLEFIKRQNEEGYLKTMKIEKGENWELDLDSVNMINTFTGARIPTDAEFMETLVDEYKSREKNL